MDIVDTVTTQVKDALTLGERLVELPSQPAAETATAVASTNSALTTSSPTIGETTANPTDGSSDDYYSCAYEVGPQEDNIEKMVLLARGTWNTSSNIFRVPLRLAVPYAFFQDDTTPAWGQARYFRYMRTAYNVKLVVTAPAGTRGAMLLGYLPPTMTAVFPKMTASVDTTETTFVNYSQQTVCHLPHAILDVRSCNEVSLVVPYMNTSNYVNYRDEELKYNNGGAFFCMIIASLTPPLGSTNAVGFSIYGELMDLDLQCPMLPTNPQGRKRTPRRHQVPKPGLAQDPPSTNIEPGPGSAVIGNSTLVSRAQTMAVANERTAIDLRTAGARAPFVDLMQVARRWDFVSFTALSWNHNAAAGTEITGFEIGFGNTTWPTMNFLAEKFQYWRGSIEVRVIVYATSFTSGKFQLCWYPHDSEQRAQQSDMGKYRNSIFVTGDVSSRFTTLVCPFTSETWRMATARASRSGGIGRVSMRVVNPLTTGAGNQQAPAVVFQIRAGQDFSFYCPVSGVNKLKVFNYGLEEEDQDQDRCFINFETHQVDIDGASHTDIKHIFGRSWHMFSITGTSPTIVRSACFAPTFAVGSLLRAFIYFSGELVFTFINYSPNPAYIAHSYLQLDVSSIASLSALGPVIIPPGETKTVVAPFYSEQPLRAIHATSGKLFSDPVFGWLYSLCDGGHIETFLALRNPNLFGLSPIPSYGGTQPYGLSPEEFFDLDQEEQGICLEIEKPSCRQHNDVVDCHFCDWCEKMKKWNSKDRRFRFCLRLKQLGLELNLEYDSQSQKELAKQGIEPNPGPVYLVYQDRGLYRHYGVASGGFVYHVNSQNILKAAISGNVDILKEPFVAPWLIDKVVDNVFLEHYLKLAPFETLKFSFQNNCETWAKFVVADRSMQQSDRIVMATAAMITFYLFMNLPCLVDKQSGAGGMVASLMTKMTDLIFGRLECQVALFVIKCVVRILCYLILYAHAPNLMTTACLVTLLLMDVNSGSSEPGLKALCSALVEGDFSQFCELLLEKAQVVDYREAKESIPQFRKFLKDQGHEDQGAPSPKPFNDWTNAAKNVRWWIESLLAAFNWVKSFFSSKTSDIASWAEEHDTEIATVIACAEEHIMKVSTDRRYASSTEAANNHKLYVRTLQDISHNISVQKNSTQFVSRINSLLAKLISLQLETTPEWKCRPEPVGLWITGSPGCGKSFFCNMVAKRVRDACGFTIYSNPTGSDFMDGYTNQQIHIFDDFGQNREEPEFGLICNLMSSIQFSVPKAALEQKGTLYQGRLVIITTNKHDFSSCTLLDPGALERRFPFRYHIRPKAKYMYQGKFNAELAAETGDLQKGECWERRIEDNNGSEVWAPLNLGFLVGSIIDAIKTREGIADLMNQGITDLTGDNAPACLDLTGEDMLDSQFEDLELRQIDFTPFVGQNENGFGFFEFECPRARVPKPSEERVKRYKSWVSRFVSKLRDFVTRHQPWIMAAGALGTLCSLSVAVWQIYSKIKDKKADDNSVYSGASQVKLPKKNFSVQVKEKINQYLGTTDQGRTVDLRHICHRLVNVSAKPGKHTATALALGGKTLITYGHDPIKVMYAEEGTKEIEVVGTKVAYNEEDTDLQLLTPKNLSELRCQYKNVNSLIYKAEFSGNGWLIWKFGNEYVIQEVSDITYIGSAQTRNGTRSASAYLYNAKTSVGSCGGVLVGNVDGTPKILGIHTSGNGSTGAANRLFPVLTDQGIVTNIETYPRPLYHQPRKTCLKPSPVNDNTSALAPAVMSKNDPRLAVQIDDILLSIAMKYRVDHFNPPDGPFDRAMYHVSRLVFSVVGVQTCITYEQAVSTDLLPLDWSTSPGHKYQGRSKRSLVDDPAFRRDVEDILEGREGTYFTAHIKDELRPLPKVASGNSRCIEAANWDYVCAYRMVMGKIYNQIYADKFCISGCAVGMNAYTDFDILHTRGFDHYLCLDFSKFDGSLSAALLTRAVEVLANCHVNPALVHQIHNHTIYSTHLVSNQIWNVKGGMCSGSPCTTVVNSICNLLVCFTLMESVGVSCDDCFIITYGDDVVISCKETPDVSQLPLMAKAFFGMEMTAADKTDNLRWVGFSEVEFLKRTPTVFHGKITGKLSLQNMRDRIQWTRSGPDFQQQLDSYLCELVLHGSAVYTEEVERLKAICPIIKFPPYNIMAEKMKLIIFE